MKERRGPYYDRFCRSAVMENRFGSGGAAMTLRAACNGILNKRLHNKFNLVLDPLPEGIDYDTRPSQLYRDKHGSENLRRIQGTT